MLWIGRYGIAFGRTLRMQTWVPVRVRRFLWFWFIKGARPQDVDKKQQFPIGTEMIHEGRVYHYYKANRGLRAHQAVTRWEEEGDDYDRVPH